MRDGGTGRPLRIPAGRLGGQRKRQLAAEQVLT